LSRAAFSLLAASVTTVHEGSTEVAAEGDSSAVTLPPPEDEDPKTARAPMISSRPRIAATMIGTGLRRASDTDPPRAAAVLRTR
jgi:hypothetical protein